MTSLEEFIQSNPSAQELKRALAVQLHQRGQSYRAIRDILQVSLGFISASHQRYEERGVEGLKSHYWGTQGYLSAEQKQEIFEWLQQKDWWTLEELAEQIEDRYGVLYRSAQSYTQLLKDAGFSWKKSHSVHPGQEEAKVEAKKPRFNSCWCSGEPRSPVGRCE